MPFERLFFDLDGTLTHSHEGITRCIAHSLRTLGVESPDANELLQYVGPPLAESFAILLGTADGGRIEDAVSAYRARYRTTGVFESAVCPGIPAMLERLAGSGHRLSMVTAKPTEFAQEVLDHFGLRSFFDGVYGPELSSRAYSKASLIRGALQVTAAPRRSTAMIGDRGEDVTGARVNAVHAIAVAWGYATDEELVAARPDAIIRSVHELLDYLEGPA